MPKRILIETTQHQLDHSIRCNSQHCVLATAISQKLNKVARCPIVTSIRVVPWMGVLSVCGQSVRLSSSMKKYAFDYDAGIRLQPRKFYLTLPDELCEALEIT